MPEQFLRRLQAVRVARVHPGPAAQIVDVQILDAGPSACPVPCAADAGVAVGVAALRLEQMPDLVASLAGCDGASLMPSWRATVAAVSIKEARPVRA